MALPVPFTCTQPSGEPLLPDSTPLAQQLDDDDSDIDELHHESDAGEDGIVDDLEGDGNIADSDSGTDVDDDASSLPVTLMSGDWVAVKVFDKLPTSLKGKAKARSKVFLHVAQIEEIEDDKLFTVLFLKRCSDVEAWYAWPPNDDRSTVERDELVKLTEPVQDIDIVSRGTGYRAKLYFSEADIDNARKILDIPIRNIR